MLTIRKGADRGVTKIGWLDSRHTFSFGDYYDPKHHNFRTLRVINDDRIAGGGGFGTHPHRDMEILTCVLAGELQHRDIRFRFDFGASSIDVTDRRSAYDVLNALSTIQPNSLPPRLPSATTFLISSAQIDTSQAIA